VTLSHDVIICWPLDSQLNREGLGENGQSDLNITVHTLVNMKFVVALAFCAALAGKLIIQYFVGLIISPEFIYY